MEAACLASPDWSDLPADVLRSILELLECPDNLRVAAVCTAWHRASSEAVCRINQFPCLLYCTETAGPSAVGMYSLLEQRAYTITLPDPPITGRFVIGSSHGWLITADEKSDLVLLNPISGEQMRLPPVTTMEHIKPVMSGDGVLEQYEMFYYHGMFETPEQPTSTHQLDEYRETVYFKAVLSSDPSSAGDCTVMLIHQPYWQLSFAKVGGDTWNWIPIDTDYTDCIHHDGWFYAVNIEGTVDSFYLNGSSIIHKRITYKMLVPPKMVVYIVQAPWGDKLLVSRIINHDTECTFEIVVYKVDPDGKKLIKMTGIGDHVLFVGHNASLCLPLSDHPQLMSNCVYFTDNVLDSLFQEKTKKRDMGIYHFERNTVTNIVSPELWMTWFPPVWLTPNTSKKGITGPGAWNNGDTED
ncbi:F-box protein At2g26160-like [Lolium perenne]|uniref:F-box protein At2g26160-like n=1 Tax=Lolium perenne TaxID=4522 RepID=UPI0021F602C3|nr:F-box protein At5g25290-like [Lolium perenne]